MNEPASNVSASFILSPKPRMKQFVSVLADAITAFSRDTGIILTPTDPLDGMVLRGDAKSFAESGEQLFLDYPDPETSKQRSFFLVVNSGDRRLLAFSLIVRTGLIDGKELLSAWTRTLAFVNSTVPLFRPVLVQVNGFADGPPQGFVRPHDFDPRANPAFLTPYTYVPSGAFSAQQIDTLARAGASIETLGEGWGIRMVPDLTSLPTPALFAAAEAVLGRRPAYLQVAP